MPFYEYRCGACGHELEMLQKISAEPLVECPSCGKATLTKLMSAAGFQLKGSGWYVTDFRDGNKGKKDKGDSKPGDDGKSGTGEAKSESGASSKSDSGAGASSDSGAAGKGGKDGKSADSSTASKKDDSKPKATKTDTNSGASSRTTDK